jgi:nicotinamidase/pyrazinamidase
VGTAIIVVDVQNDFTEGGALGVDGGDAIAAGITALLRAHGDRFGLVIASRDWHEPDSSNGGHFPPAGVAPDYRTTWPLHCLQGTPGADFNPAFDASLADVGIFKGMGASAYSAFEGRTAEGASLADVLAVHGVDALVICGLATDYCVLQTVLDARERALPVVVLEDLMAGVAPESSAAAVARMREAGAVVESSAAWLADAG